MPAGFPETYERQGTDEQRGHPQDTGPEVCDRVVGEAGGSVDRQAAGQEDDGDGDLLVGAPAETPTETPTAAPTAPNADADRTVDGYSD